MIGNTGISSLGYIGFQARDPAAWKAFLTGVLGVMPAASRDGDNRYRIDEQAWRISVEEGDADDLVFVGFEVADGAALEAIAARLTAHEVHVEPASEALRKERGVLGLLTCTDPDGLDVELYYGPGERQSEPFTSPAGVSGFMTGSQGLGHYVLGTANIAALRAFYCDALGMALSDIISMKIGPERTLDLEFYHCNSRHHTVAIAPAASPKRMHHFMLQVNTLDEVGFALDRAISAKCHVVQTLGRHTNDHMVSFYVATPSGTQVEYGWGARDVNLDDWRVVRHDRTSSWGHKFQPAPED